MPKSLDPKKYAGGHYACPSCGAQWTFAFLKPKPFQPTYKNVKCGQCTSDVMLRFTSIKKENERKVLVQHKITKLVPWEGIEIKDKPSVPRH